MPPTSLFRKYHMHTAMLFIWYKYKFYINAIHMQHWTKYRAVSYTYVGVQYSIYNAVLFMKL